MTISGILVYFLALPQPAPVNNLTIPSFVFDNARPVKKKLKLTTSWTAPERMYCFRFDYLYPSNSKIYEKEPW